MESATWKPRLARAGRWLVSAPLVLTLAGALLVPWITRTWQNREHEHQLKGALVTEMSDAFTAPVLTAQFIATGLIAKHLKDPAQRAAAVQLQYEQGLRAWRLTSARVATEIEAHFPTEVKQQWTAYAEIVTDFYRLSAEGLATQERSRLVDQVQTALGGHGEDVHWAALIPEAHELSFRTAYVAASEDLLTAGDYLVQSVLAHRAEDL